MAGGKRLSRKSFSLWKPSVSVIVPSRRLVLSFKRKYLIWWSRGWGSGESDGPIVEVSGVLAVSLELCQDGEPLCE